MKNYFSVVRHDLGGKPMKDVVFFEDTDRKDAERAWALACDIARTWEGSRVLTYRALPFAGPWDRRIVGFRDEAAIRLAIESAVVGEETGLNHLLEELANREDEVHGRRRLRSVA